MTMEVSLKFDLKTRWKEHQTMINGASSTVLFQNLIIGRQIQSFIIFNQRKVLKSGTKYHITYFFYEFEESRREALKLFIAQSCAIMERFLFINHILVCVLGCAWKTYEFKLFLNVSCGICEQKTNLLRGMPVWFLLKSY